MNIVITFLIFINFHPCYVLIFDDYYELEFDAFHNTFINYSAKHAIENFQNQNQNQIEIDLAKLFYLQKDTIVNEQSKKQIQHNKYKIKIKLDKFIYNILTFNKHLNICFDEYIIMKIIYSRAYEILIDQISLLKKIFTAFFENNLNCNQIFVEFFKTTTKYQKQSKYANEIANFLVKKDVNGIMNYRQFLLKTIFQQGKEKTNFENSFENDFFHWESAYSDLFAVFRNTMIVSLHFLPKNVHFFISEDYIFLDNNFFHVHFDKMITSNLLYIYKNIIFNVDILNKGIIDCILQIIHKLQLSQVKLDITRFVRNFFGCKMFKTRIKFHMFQSFISSFKKLKLPIIIKIKDFKIILYPNESDSLYGIEIDETSKYCFFDSIYVTTIKIMYIFKDEESKNLILYKLASKYFKNYIHSQKNIAFHQLYDLRNSHHENLFKSIKIKCNHKIFKFKMNALKFFLFENMDFYTIILDKKLQKSNLLKELKNNAAEKKHLNVIFQKNYCFLEIIVGEPIDKITILPEYCIEMKKFVQTRTDSKKSNSFYFRLKNLCDIESVNSHSSITYEMKVQNIYNLEISNCIIEFTRFSMKIFSKIYIVNCMIYTSFNFRKMDKMKFSRSNGDIQIQNTYFYEKFELYGSFNEIIIDSCSSKLVICADYKVIKIFGCYEKYQIIGESNFTFKSLSKDSYFIYDSTENKIRAFEIIFLKKFCVKKIHWEFTNCKLIKRE